MTTDAVPQGPPAVADAGPAPVGEPVVRMSGITIAFPGVKALSDVSFRLFPGEVHALMGENGAGKSTLIKALTGVYSIDAGSIEVAGNEVSFAGPAEAQQAGVATVYQEVNLVTNLSVAENIMLGREPRFLGAISFRAMRKHSRSVLKELNLDIDPGSLLGSHSIAVQQLVSIARAIDIQAQVLVLDEPTSSLDVDEVAELFRIIRKVRDQGVAVLFVSHFLEQVYEISDRITVLRNGELVGEYLTAELPRLQLISRMIGKELAALDALEEGTKREAGELGRPGPVLPRRGSRPVGIGAAVRPGHPSGRGGRAGRPAGVGSHRGRPADLRRRPHRLWVRVDRWRSRPDPQSAGGARPQHRLRVGEP